jgi:membrane dipeptidase
MAKYPVFDGHNDSLFEVHYTELTGGRDFFKNNVEGHIDLPRAREGGLAGGFFAVYVPSEPQYRKPRGTTDTVYTDAGYSAPMAREFSHDYAKREAAALISTLTRLVQSSNGAMQIVRTASEIEDCIKRGVFAVLLHFEGAEPIDPDLELLPVYYEQGLRSIGLVWSRPNAFATGVPFRFPHSPDTGPGLSDLGKNLVRACNRLRIMIDLSHLNEAGFWDVSRLTDAPLVATHTAAHAITPSTRNLTDKQLDAIRDSDGMVGLNFNVRDIRPDGRPDTDTPLSDYIRQLDYLVDKLGIDHVGFGSDFDGASISIHIGDATGLPKLTAALEAHGYDPTSLNKITHENWVRVLRKTWGA